MGYGIAKSFYRTRTKTKNKVQDRGVMTSQRDVKTIYRRKPMPRRRRKQWVSFKRKVTATQIANSALMSFFRQQVMYLTTAANASSFTTATIYSYGGINGTEGTTGSASGTGQGDDLVDFWTTKYGLTSVGRSRKTMFASACMDVHIRNSGAASGILEIYEIIARRDYGSSSVSYDSIEELYTNGFTDTVATPLFTAVTSSTLGSTPFQNKLFCQQFKVLKKTRVEISAGETISMQMRDPKNRVAYGAEMNANLIFKRGATRGYLFQLYGEPSGTATQKTTACECRVTVLKSYTYRELDSQPATTGLAP